MKRILIAAAVTAFTTLTAISAHAGCNDQRALAQHGTFHRMSSLRLENSIAGRGSENASAAENIVGTWHVTYTGEGGPAGEAFIQWHSDGTEWENINFPILGGNVCLGSWKAVDKTRVYRSHIGWLYTNGILSGYFTETETDRLGRDGNSYSGINDTKIYDLDGNLQLEMAGTAAATRISP